MGMVEGLEAHVLGFEVQDFSQTKNNEGPEKELLLKARKSYGPRTSQWMCSPAIMQRSHSLNRSLRFP